MCSLASINKKQNYQIISLIGQGAYGQVYKARKKFTGQFVAIKSIKKKGKQEKDIKAMRQQIEILKKLKHQNIILLLDSFETNSQFILVTQLGQGELFNIIEDDQSLQIEQIRKIAQQAVRALHYIHSNRITHRDLKPQNILMTSDGVIKLCDFGFARSMSYKTQVLTSLKGTPLYMAPEVVKQEPYNHSADLWSLGVILYELATGNPPFTAPNLITLVDHISKDPIHYPQSISGEFKSFLKGLLNKDPKKRLGWPQLLQHPFIIQNQDQRKQRKEKSERFSSWIQENVINQQQARGKNLQTLNSKYVPGSGFYQKREISPLKNQDSTPSKIPIQKSNISSDSIWTKYLSKTAEENGSQILRSDQKFLENILDLMQLSTNDIIRDRQKRQRLALGVKVLVQVLMKSKSPEDLKQGRKIDVARNFNVPNGLLKILKNLLKAEYCSQFIQILSDIIKVIGLLARVTFQKNLGIQMIYIRTFLPLFPEILSSIYKGENNQTYQNYTINFLRTVGMFVNNASCNHIRSFSFYKDLVQLKIIQQSIGLAQHFGLSSNVLKLYIQVLSAIIHPVFGDIQCFPWNKESYSQFKDFMTMAECVRLSIVNTLQESSYSEIFEAVLQQQDQSSVLPKISITRIILQSVRISRQFAESLLKNKKLIRLLLQIFSNKDQILFSANCYTFALLVKHIKERNRSNDFKDLFEFLVQTGIKNLGASLNSSLKQLKQNNQLVTIYSSLYLFYELISLQDTKVLQKVYSLVISDAFYKFCSMFLGDCTNNKLQQMRKLEGSNYGIHPYGIYDSLFLFLHRFNTQALKQLDKKQIDMYLQSLKKSQMVQKVPSLIESLSSKTDLSLRGFVTYLIYLEDLLNLGIIEPFISEKFIISLVNILRQDQINNLNQWPTQLGGGKNCLTIIFGNIGILILTLLRHSQRLPILPKTLCKSRFIEYCVNFAKYLDKENIVSLVSILAHLIVFDKSGSEKNDKQSFNFSGKFIEYGGMALFPRFGLLDVKQHSNSSLVENCNFLSLLAKISKDYYPYIETLKPFEMIFQLLNSSDSQLRAKVLNMIGNMCRHSGYFYQKLQQSGILQKCIKLCEDSDRNVKKFACVAIGNACFHDDSLYHFLRPSIPILANLLKDAQEKMRSNAAAALGNLARNSKLLDKDFVQSGVLFQLANMVLNQKSIACKKVCVMAIVNLLGLPESGKILIEQNIQNNLKKYTVPNFTGDPALSKVCQKALDRIQKKDQQK